MCFGRSSYPGWVRVQQGERNVNHTYNQLESVASTYQGKHRSNLIEFIPELRCVCNGHISLLVYDVCVLQKRMFSKMHVYIYIYIYLYIVCNYYQRYFICLHCMCVKLQCNSMAWVCVCVSVCQDACTHMHVHVLLLF